ncbi:hypothetical protein VCHC50A2_2026B, partial [Vibrio cholerae HC-50A2]
IQASWRFAFSRES